MFVRLEAALCAFEGTATATVAPSGYAANMAALEALGGRDAVIFSDELNHASIIDGCRASRARVEVFAHRDLDDLERRLRECDGRCVIVTDGVFSTEGTVADVRGLAELADRYEAWLVVDEAHATGVVGDDGRGTVAAAGASDNPLVVRVVTFSKALGASGAAVCGADTVRQLLLQRGRPLIYSTALPHPVIAAALAAVEVLQRETELRRSLRANVQLLHEELDGLATDTHDCSLPMVPVPIGEATHAMEVENALWDAGWMVHALRPPTVPPGASRLRITASALHEPEDIRGLAAALRTILV